MEIEVMGKKYPAEYTVSAQKRLAGIFGGIGKEQMERAFFAETPISHENMAIWADELIEAGIARAKILCEMGGKEYEGPEKALGAETLTKILRPKDMNRLLRDIITTINDGSRTEVEVEEGKKTEKAEGSA